MNEIYTYFGLENGTKDFIGHAMVLWSTDDYLNEVARPYLRKNHVVCFVCRQVRQVPVHLSIIRVGRVTLKGSPDYRPSTVVHTCWIPQLTRYCTRRRSRQEICWCGHKEGTARAPTVIADPTYFPENVKRLALKLSGPFVFWTTPFRC